MQALRIARSFLGLPARLPNSLIPSRLTSTNVDEQNISHQIIDQVNAQIDGKKQGRMFAVVQVCGKQFKVTDDDIIVVDGYWPPTTGDQIRLEKVLLLGASDFTLVGRPILPLNQVSVKATVIEKALTHTKVSFKYVKRKQFKNINFLRVPQTHLRINSIEILGTPGTGKSKLAEAVAAECSLRWLDVSAEATRRNCCPEYDDQLKCAILDEDLLLDSLEPEMAPGGVILDYHGCDFFPERWIDVVFVLRTDNTLLYDRLSARGYDANKIQENISAEIFQTILEEAKGSYREDIVFECHSNNEEQFQANKQRVVEFVNHWRDSRGSNRRARNENLE